VINFILGQYYNLINLNFSERIYFNLFLVLGYLIFVFTLILAIKFFLRPRKSKFSRYKLLGKDVVWLMSLMLINVIIFALARPQIEKGNKTVQGGIDVIIAIDHSFSMKADDINPTRLEAVKKEIAKLISGKVLKNGDKISLFAFARSSFWRVPITEDFDEFLSGLSLVGHPDVFYEESQLDTNLGILLQHIPESIDKQDEFFKNYGRELGVLWKKNRRIIIIFSDGDDQANDDTSFRIGIQNIKRNNMKVYCVGVGTKKGARVKIKIKEYGSMPNLSNGHEYQENKYQSGAQNNNGQQGETVENLTIFTRLQTQTLERIASLTGGKFYTFDSENRNISNFLRDSIDSNRSLGLQVQYSEKKEDIWWDVFAIPLLFLVFLIILFV